MPLHFGKIGAAVALLVMGLTLAQLSMRLRGAKCGAPLQSVKPWRQEDVLGKPKGVAPRMANFNR
jgi:hypothetical protein